MKYLLDTCVISELVNKKPNPQVVEFIDGVDQDDVFLSVITLGDVVKGIEKIREAKRKNALHRWLNEELIPRFAGNLLPIDERVVATWGRISARSELEGRKLPAIDALLAATALANGLSLVTRNVDDFQVEGLEVINPWGE